MSICWEARRTQTVSGGDTRPWWLWGCWAEGSRVGMVSQTQEGGTSSVLVLLRSWKAFVLVLSSEKHFNNV